MCKPCFPALIITGIVLIAIFTTGLGLSTKYLYEHSNDKACRVFHCRTIGIALISVCTVLVATGLSLLLLGIALLIKDKRNKSKNKNNSTPAFSSVINSGSV